MDSAIVNGAVHGDSVRVSADRLMVASRRDQGVVTDGDPMTGLMQNSACDHAQETGRPWRHRAGRPARE